MISCRVPECFVPRVSCAEFRALNFRACLWYPVLIAAGPSKTNMESNAQNAASQKQAMIYICGGKYFLFILWLIYNLIFC